MKEKTWLPGNISDRVCDLREEWGLTRKEPAPRSRALYSMGVDLEAARERLRQLVAQGISYQSTEMRQAYQWNNNGKIWSSIWNCGTKSCAGNIAPDDLHLFSTTSD